MNKKILIIVIVILIIIFGFLFFNLENTKINNLENKDKTNNLEKPNNKKTISTIDFNFINSNQLQTISLNQKINIPLTKNDANIIINKLKEDNLCFCNGDLKLNNNNYVVSCCEAYPDCEIKINIDTGYTTCAHFG